MFTNVVTTCFVVLVIFHICVSEPHCSKFHYEEKLLEKMIRLEISVEAMKKEIEESRNQVTTTLGNLQTERSTWEKTLLTTKDTSVTALDTAIQETKTQVQDELNVLAAEKERWNKELKECVKIPEVVVFSARNPKDTSLTNGQTMVFTEIILNKGDAYSKENGVFTVPYAGIYTFTVQFCVYPGKYFDFAFMANGTPFKRSRIQRHSTSYFSCYSFDAVTIVDKNDNVKIKIIGCYSGTTLGESSDYYWNTFSGRLIQAI
ncbi:EMILIN-2-like [Mercenaria mercenaria]|uniref:EMILIN-2-like n=1 Tax=Mercenaria mercenaria TaxID=6596 RepID=UPI00234F5D13|nr:EMILIN-2-like [Mercenaria mercenaria]